MLILGTTPKLEPRTHFYTFLMSNQYHIQVFIEEKFNLKLNKEEINDKNFASINAISKFIYSKIKK